MDQIRKFVKEAHVALGMSREHASTVSDVFVRATLRGVGHHDIHDLPGRLKTYKNGDVNVNADIQLLSGYGGMERYDGDNGSGELGCAFITNRAYELAQIHGIGFCTIRHSNHFLASAPYTEMAAEKGTLGVLYTRTPPSLSNPQGTAKVVGTSPMGFAAPTNREYPIMLDVCLSYLSFGVLNDLVQKNEKVPGHWGKDSQGNSTTDPNEIKEGGHRLPIGGHKGFGLAMLTEILTGVLSGGQIIDQENPNTNGSYGMYSHTAIAFKADALMPIEEFRQRTTEMIERMENRDPDMHIPGQGSYRSKKEIEAENGINLSADFIHKLNSWANDLNIDSIENDSFNT